MGKNLSSLAVGKEEGEDSKTEAADKNRKGSAADSDSSNHTIYPRESGSHHQEVDPRIVEFDDHPGVSHSIRKPFPKVTTDYYHSMQVEINSEVIRGFYNTPENRELWDGQPVKILVNSNLCLYVPWRRALVKWCKLL